MVRWFSYIYITILYIYYSSIYIYYLVIYSHVYIFFQISLPDFPGGSDGKESACNAGGPGSIPGSGRSPGEGNGYPLQYSSLENSMDYTWGCKEPDTTEWLSLSLYQKIGRHHGFPGGKNQPAMWEMWVRSLGQDDPLKKEMATHPSILPWDIPQTEEPGGL